VLILDLQSKQIICLQQNKFGFSKIFVAKLNFFIWTQLTNPIMKTI